MGRVLTYSKKILKNEDVEMVATDNREVLRNTKIQAVPGRNAAAIQI